MLLQVLVNDICLEDVTSLSTFCLFQEILSIDTHLTVTNNDIIWSWIYYRCTGITCILAHNTHI